MSNGLDLLPKCPHGSKMSKIEKAYFELFPQINRKFDPDRKFWLSLLSNFCVIVNLRVCPFQHTFNHIPTTRITS